MNSKIYKLISSIASVLLCGVLLVCVCLAWYTNNQDVDTAGIQGVTSSDECNLTVDVYYLESFENNVYKKAVNPIDFNNVTASSPIEGEQELGTTIMNKFGEGITGILIVANVTLYEHASGSFQLSVSTPTNNILMLETVDETKSIPEQLNQYQNNMLSNVIHFEEATTDFTTHEVVVNHETMTSFIENKQKKRLVNLKSDIKKSEADADSIVTQQFCFVIDYDETYVNYLYEQMLTLFGKNANLDTPMLFQSDISFRLSKGSDVQ